MTHYTDAQLSQFPWEDDRTDAERREDALMDQQLKVHRLGLAVTAALQSGDNNKAIDTILARSEAVLKLKRMIERT
jgi:hypothetical protein